MSGAACKAKVILNGGAIQDAANRLCYQVEEIEAADFPYDEGVKMVKLLNEAEDLVFRAQRIFLESIGFDGPWPNALKLK
jgi:hypothetical protein